jgi:hypothetical protein
MTAVPQHNPSVRNLKMNIQKLLLPAIATLIVMTNTNIASADNGLSFPPVNTLRNYQYPPQAPVAPRLNRMPAKSAPYVFGQNRSQPRQKMIPTPAQVQSFRNRSTQPQMIPNSRPPFAPRNFGNNVNNNSNNNTGNNFPFSNTNMMPFGNSGNNGFNPFSKGSMPFSNNSGGMMPTNPMNKMFANNNNQNFNMPFFNSNNNRKKAWGDRRNIWPDFYTDFTDEAWDKMMSSPRDMGRMPGGWRFPYISMPDPVTVSDAITNQFPPIAEEAGNMADFSDWGVFD